MDIPELHKLLIIQENPYKPTYKHNFCIKKKYNSKLKKIN